MSIVKRIIFISAQETELHQYLVGGDSQIATAFCSCKTIQRRHKFCLKVNFLCSDRKGIAGCVVDNANGMLSSGATDENEIMTTVDALEGKWNIESRDYQHEDAFVANGFRFTLLELIVIRFKKKKGTLAIFRP